MSVQQQLPMCAEMFDEGLHKLYSVPAFIITCSVQKRAYFHNTAFYSHLFYLFTNSVKEIRCEIEVLWDMTLSVCEQLQTFKRNVIPLSSG